MSVQCASELVEQKNDQLAAAEARIAELEESERHWLGVAELATKGVAARDKRIAELEACWNASDVLIGTIEDENKELRARIAELEAALRETIDALYDTHDRQEACPICRQIAERAKATLQK